MKSSKKKAKKVSLLGSKPWACKMGCDLNTGIPCQHLEALLPSMQRGEDRSDRSIMITYVKDIERYTHSAFEEEEAEYNLPSIMQILDAIPELTDRHKLIVPGRLFGNLSYRELAEYTGLNVRTVFYLYKEAMAILQEYK